MFKQPSKYTAGYRSTAIKLLLFILSVALLTSPFVSSQGQVISSSPECHLGLNNEPVRCTGWVKCDNVTSILTINAVMYTYQSCPGYIVHNDARVYTLANLTGIGADGQTLLYSALDKLLKGLGYIGIGADGQTLLYSGAGPILKYKYTSMSCLKKSL